MYRFLEYALFFAVVILLQVLLFDNLDLSVYIHPVVYIAFILLLPMETPAVAVLLLGLLTGAATDLLSGMPGLNTIATLFTAYARPLMLGLVAGKDEVKDGGAPTVGRLGAGKYFRYSGIMICAHCFVMFTFESLTWDFYYLTLLRIVLSSAVSIVFVWLVQMLLPGNYAPQPRKKI